MPIDRLWPRGVTKAIAAIDLWAEERCAQDCAPEVVQARP